MYMYLYNYEKTTFARRTLRNFGLQTWCVQYSYLYGTWLYTCTYTIMYPWSHVSRQQHTYTLVYVDGYCEGTSPFRLYAPSPPRGLFSIFLTPPSATCHPRLMPALLSRSIPHLRSSENVAAANCTPLRHRLAAYCSPQPVRPTSGFSAIACQDCSVALALLPRGDWERRRGLCVRARPPSPALLVRTVVSADGGGVPGCLAWQTAAHSCTVSRQRTPPLCNQPVSCLFLASWRGWAWRIQGWT